MKIISFYDSFRREGLDYLGTVKQGTEDFPKLDKLIKETSSRETILFDISKFELFGYSYAKQTIRKVLQMSKAGLYDHRYFLAFTPTIDYAEELSNALTQLHLSMICSTSKNSKSFYKKYFVIGEINEAQKITLDYIIKKKEITSGIIKKTLIWNLYQFASNRIRKLVDDRLVRWEVSPERQRNVLNCRRIEL